MWYLGVSQQWGYLKIIFLMWTWMMNNGFVGFHILRPQTMRSHKEFIPGSGRRTCSELFFDFIVRNMCAYILYIYIHKMYTHESIILYNMYIVYYTCLRQRTENHAHKKQGFASVCSEVMKGWGREGILTFLVTCASSATCCYAAQMSGSVASLYTLSKWSAVLEGGHMGC